MTFVLSHMLLLRLPADRIEWALLLLVGVPMILIGSGWYAQRVVDREVKAGTLPVGELERARRLRQQLAVGSMVIVVASSAVLLATIAL
jgi:hypothetical protein